MAINNLELEPTKDQWSIQGDYIIFGVDYEVLYFDLEEMKDSHEDYNSVDLKGFEHPAIIFHK